MQVFVVCNVLVAWKLSRPSILLIPHLALSGETHKIVLPYSMWLCWKAFVFWTSFPPIILAATRREVLSPKVHTPWDGFGSTPVHLARSESWWRWTVLSISMSCYPWWVLGWSMMSSQDDTLHLPEMEKTAKNLGRIRFFWVVKRQDTELNWFIWANYNDLSQGNPKGWG